MMHGVYNVKFVAEIVDPGFVCLISMNKTKIAKP